MNVNLQLSTVFSNLQFNAYFHDKMKLKFTGIIPARYDSKRFPGKPLAIIDGVPMVIRVWEKAKKALNNVYIATDHQKIYEVATKAGAKVVLTASNHQTGTDRIAEAAALIFDKEDSDKQVILNIQGDEPMITSDAILDLCKAFNDTEVGIATLIHEFQDPEEINNPNRPKVVIDNNGDALLFSRSPILKELVNYQHVGVYAFKLNTLKEISNLKPTPLEQQERLEQIRWLENGYHIRCVKTDYKGIGVDCPEDLEAISRLMNRITEGQ